MFQRLQLNHVLWMVVIAAVAVVTVQRLWLAQDLPLWIDETWTAMIVSRPGWGEFWRQVWLDCNAPLYYLVIRLWEGVAGQSNWALRIPSLIFVTAAGVLPALWRAPGISRETALTWAALLCLWWPGVAISLDARAYSLLLLVSVAQTIAYAQVLEAPGFRRALLWSGLASLAILTHYHAVILAAVQGLMLLGLRRPWRTWPAALLFLPAFIWLAVHAPRLTDYARPDVAWYEPVTFDTLGVYVRYLLGPEWRLFPTLVTAVAIAGAIWKRPRASTLWVVVGAGFAALLIALAIGAVRPTMTPRYLVPVVPAILLGVALAVHRSRVASIALVVLFLGAILTPQAHLGRVQGRATYGYEPHSQWLMAARPDQLVFTWDHPVSGILDESSLRGIGGYFFERAGHRIETEVVVLEPGEDPNLILPAAAEGKRPAVIWLYNRGRNSAARTHPPRDWPGWRCMSTSLGSIGTVACTPSDLREQP